MEQLAHIHGTINRPRHAQTMCIDAQDFKKIGSPNRLPVLIATVNGIERYGNRQIAENNGWLIVHLWHNRQPEYLQHVTVLLAN